MDEELKKRFSDLERSLREIRDEVGFIQFQNGMLSFGISIIVVIFFYFRDFI